MNNPFLPFGFTAKEEIHPIVQNIKERIEYLNGAITKSGIPGHQFAAALALLMEKGRIPASHLQAVAQEDLVQIVKSLLPLVAQEPEPLEFPNVVPLVDCRFVTTSEWEQIRRFSIGGSDSGIIMGKSHYRSERELWLDKMGKYHTLKDPGRDYLFAYGHAVEDFVLEKLAGLLGAKRYPEHRMFRNKECPFLSVNMDGILVLPSGALTVAEAKTAIRWKMEDWNTALPEDYGCQLNHYMGNMNDPRLITADIGCVFGGLPSEWASHHVVKDQAACDAQMEAEIRWWNDYILAEKMPPLSGDPEMDKRAVFLNTDFKVKENKEIDLPFSDLDIIRSINQSKEERKKLRKEISTLKVEEDKIMAEISAMCPDGTTLCACAAENQLTYRIRKKERVREYVEFDQAQGAQVQRALAKQYMPEIIPYGLPKVK